jgi:deoxyribose-phosphate aldolase
MVQDATTRRARYRKEYRVPKPKTEILRYAYSYSIPLAKALLEGSAVGICPVIGFPDGNSTTTIKMQEALEAVKAGGKEIDMVDVRKVLSLYCEYVEDEIRMVNDVVRC